MMFESWQLAIWMMPVITASEMNTLAGWQSRYSPPVSPKSTEAPLIITATNAVLIQPILRKQT